MGGGSVRKVDRRDTINKSVVRHHREKKEKIKESFRQITITIA